MNTHIHSPFTHTHTHTHTPPPHTHTHTHTQAVDYFATLIGKNVYALFFFAGHGFEYNARNYMMPVDSDVEKKPEQCVCAQEVLDAMQVGGAKLSIMILDMCRVSAST